MKPTQIAIKKSTECIEKTLKSSHESQLNIIKDLKKAKNRTEAMKIKEQLLGLIIIDLPVGTTCCSFCYTGGKITQLCGTCLYRRKKGICGHKLSAYGQFQRARTELQQAITNAFKI